jgi:hypothetical protein
MTYVTEQHPHLQLLQCLLGPIPSVLQMNAAWSPETMVSAEAHSIKTSTLHASCVDHAHYSLPMQNIYATHCQLGTHILHCLQGTLTLWPDQGIHTHLWMPWGNVVYTAHTTHCLGHMYTHTLACLLWTFLWNISTALSNYKLSHSKTQHFAALCILSPSHYTIICLYTSILRATCGQSDLCLWLTRFFSNTVYIPPSEWQTPFWVIWWMSQVTVKFSVVKGFMHSAREYLALWTLQLTVAGVTEIQHAEIQHSPYSFSSKHSVVVVVIIIIIIIIQAYFGHWHSSSLKK